MNIKLGDFTFKVDLDLSELKRIKKNVIKLRNSHIKFGWFSTKKYPSDSRTKGLVSDMALIQEFGAKMSNGTTIPPRPYFQQSVRMSYSSNKDSMVEAMKLAMLGKDFNVALYIAGENLKQMYHASVLKQNMRKLHPVTIKHKGFETQMIESGVLTQSYEYKIVKKHWSYSKE